jgi:branched-chain amino acid aminotransferase
MRSMEISPEAVERLKTFELNDTDLGFGKYMSPIMIQAIWKNGQWGPLKLLPYGPLELDPCVKVLHYAQEIFEGMKAYRHPDGNVSLFRPHLNAKRFNESAKRMAMPTLPEELFLKACEAMVGYSYDLVPRRLGESLYLRPFMFASEVGLGIKPADEFMFLVVASPSGNYFRGSSLKVFVEKSEVRAVHGGCGAAKTGGNYAASLNAYKRTLEHGCDQTMWLDALEHSYIEEMSGMNFFALINNNLVTPPLSDSILDGITRKSLIELAESLHIMVIEERIHIDHLLQKMKKHECTEAFVCGTASVLAPIQSFHFQEGAAYHFAETQGRIGQTLREHLVGLQSGRVEDKFGWNKFIERVDI